MRIEKIEIFGEARTFIDRSSCYYPNLFQATLPRCPMTYFPNRMVLHSFQPPINQLQLNQGNKGPIGVVSSL